MTSTLSPKRCYICEGQIMPSAPEWRRERFRLLTMSSTAMLLPRTDSTWEATRQQGAEK